jgi:tetratricopeptide (TPR) repeat protein
MFSSIATMKIGMKNMIKYKHGIHSKHHSKLSYHIHSVIQSRTMIQPQLETLDTCVTTKHHYFSSTKDTTSSDLNIENDSLKRPNSYQFLLQHITHSTRSLGVWEGVESLYTTPEQNLWESIQELPEIEMVRKALEQIQQPVDAPSVATSLSIIHTTQYKIAITALERAIQIFGSYRPGGREQLASYALLSEFQNRCHHYDSAHSTLQELLSAHKNNENNNSGTSSNAKEDGTLNDIVQIAMAKLFWYQGKHAEGKAICDSLVDEERTVGVVARTGQAVTRLLLVSSLDDVFSVRDPFRMSIKRLERMVHSSATVLAAAYLNMGIAEMVWAETVSQHNDVDAPLDAAMRNWKQGITILTKGELTGPMNTASTSSRTRPNKDSPVRSILHARLLSNMAYGMLHMNHHADYITRSLEYASESLAIYDAMKISNNNNEVNASDEVSTESSVLIDKEGLSRTLSILGTCYHLHGNAIIAQGLFQSALDKVPVNFTKLSADATPLQLVEQSDTYDRYSDLCNDWDEREGDSKHLRQKADEINANLLPNGWKDKTSIHGSLWFWTGATIQRH